MTCRFLKTPPAWTFYYADDVTQIITSNGTTEDHKTLVLREARRLNNFEKTWKIKTNIDTFFAVALGKKKLQDLQIKGNTISHQKQCHNLGHTVTSTSLRSDRQTSERQNNEGGNSIPIII